MAWWYQRSTIRQQPGPILSTGLLISIALASASAPWARHHGPASGVSDWEYKGIAITAYWKGAFDNPYFERQIDYYKRIGANAVQLVPILYQEDTGSDRIATKQWREKGISDRELIDAIRMAHRKKLKVNLKPHLEPYPEGIPRLSSSDLDALSAHLAQYPEARASFDRCYRSRHTEAPGRLDPDLSERKQRECTRIIRAIKPELFWRARIAPSDAEAWFRSYGDLLRDYLDIALDNDVEVLTLGTEMVCLTRPRYLSRWKALVADLKDHRARFHAEHPGTVPSRPLLTYAAHENEIIGTPNDEERPRSTKKEAADLALSCGERRRESGANDPLERTTVLDPGVRGRPATTDDIRAYRRFWDLFDLVGVTAYFKLGTKWPYELEDETSVDSLAAVTGTSAQAERDGTSPSLRSRWQAKLRELKRWRQLVAPGKPVILAELGYRSVDFGHHKPYQSADAVFPGLSDTSGSRRLYSDDPRYQHNETNQRNAFDAAMEALSGADWIRGAFIWQEEIKMPPIYARPEDNSYSLIGKPAAAVIERAYTDGPATEWERVPSCHDLSFNWIDRYDLDIGGGTSLTRLDDESSFVWTKARVRPLSFCFGSALLREAQLGIWASGAWGDGKDAASESNYSWDRGLIGVTAKLLGKGLTWDIDLGIGSLYNRSSSRGGRFRSRQDDDVWSLFTHIEWRRRDEGYRAFPKVELDFEGIWSMKAREHRTWEGQPLDPDPLDRDRMEATLAIGLFDQSIPGSPLRLTPSIALGHVWQDLDRDYGKAGVGLTLGLDEKGDRTDLATLRCLYDDRKGGIWGLTLWMDLLEIGRTVAGSASSSRQ